MESRFVLQGDRVVVDRKTGLVWQKSASTDRMVWKNGFEYIDKLNASKYAGFGDWRYPTKDELQTLILPEEDRNTGHFADPLFGHQRNCWTSTEGEHHKACYVDFYYGDVYLIEENYANHFVRAVRGTQAA